MTRPLRLFTCAVAATLHLLMPTSSARAAEPAADPYLWLEDVTGDKALAWARAQNAAAENEFAADPRYEPLRRNLLNILNSRERIPYVTQMGAHYYNFWRDAANPRGLWRRTTLAEYRTPQPAWETVLDLDALAKRESENWVWKGAECLRPLKDGEPYRRCILALSRGGADATVLREFDVENKRFVLDGFVLTEAKQDVEWKDLDTVWVGTDFGPGSMTTSGYPRIARQWKRGTPLSTARTVYEGQSTDVGVWMRSEWESGQRRDWITRAIAFWNTEHLVLVDSQPVKLDLPADAAPVPFRDWLLVRTRSPWTVGGTTHPGGSLLAIRYAAFMKGERAFDVLYTPTARSALDTSSDDRSGVRVTRSAVLFIELDNVRPRLWELRHDGKAWQRTRVDLPDTGQVANLATYWASDDYFFTHQDFTTPTTLFTRTVGQPKSEALKSLPRFFDANGIVTRQFEAVSADGTKIPYFIAMRDELPLDGGNPTLIYGYGGFGSTELPWYSGSFGKAWLEPGGVLVLANLRGGGEFGPQWHQAAQKANKQRTWDDLAAVAEDLIQRGITSAPHLGIMGGSQGGLLVTATMVQRPDLFGAVVSQVPLIDMLRYHKLLAGASWIAEYGDPDKPEERAFIAKYSPYQNVQKSVTYPRTFIYTSTRDDRVHPGHARKMVARMKEQGHDVLYFENIEGGHGAAANNEQAARMWAQTFTFLWGQLGHR
ncbi:MAG: prolyl oligopeptidase family serine peptidase [Burkholderiaceae bacterium]|nr:prolyl oligopeptidase family serine peptidase [Burkholderiaceae bacterium]